MTDLPDFERLPLPSGISGTARSREWDATATVEVPGLQGVSLTEIEFRLLSDETIGVLPEHAQLSPDLLQPLASALRASVPAPFVALAVRQDELAWAAGARKVNSEVIDLSVDVPGDAIGVVVPPTGDVSFSVDGEPVEADANAELAQALAEIERRGRDRFESFVARADRLGDGRWDVTVDPL
jgi:hypothetical protein